MTSASDAKTLVMRVFASLRPDSEVCLEWLDATTPSVVAGHDREAFSLDLDDGHELVMFKAADRLQTIIMEMYQTPIPPCPRHPDDHPLVAGLDEHALAVWKCPATGEALVRI